jgi:hypothetical protein
MLLKMVAACLATPLFAGAAWIDECAQKQELATILLCTSCIPSNCQQLTHTMTASSKRLFVGNLGETVDEYALLTELRKHGKISKFDYLFHKSGPKQGRPRGYAFVEYETKEVSERWTLFMMKASLTKSIWRNIASSNRQHAVRKLYER